MVIPDLYLQHQRVIDRAIDFICRRHRLSGPDGEDFASDVRLHLVSKDYAVLKAFQGRSSIETYIATVVAHRLQDWRNARWGKWRPSAAARRLGPVGVLLETLLVRDGRSLDEAIEVLRTNHGVDLSPGEIETMATRLPHRSRRTFSGDETLERLPAPDAAADAGLHAHDAAAVTSRASSALADAMRSLDARDRLILRLHLGADERVVDLARVFSMDQKRLYRHVDRLKKQLRAKLEASGLTAAGVRDALETRGRDLAVAAGSRRESAKSVRHFIRSDAPQHGTEKRP